MNTIIRASIKSVGALFMENFCAGATGRKGKNMSMNGIDISSWQKGINLNVVPCDFVIVKATGGTGYVNPDYNRAMQQAINAGKKVGVYHYARERGCKGSAMAEADFFVKNVQNYIGKAILVLDWEEELTLGVSWAKEFLDRVYQKTGVKAFLYTSASVTRQYNWASVAQAGYPLWMAQYPNNKPQNGYRDKPWTDGKGYGAFKTLAIHQYSSSGRLPGYNGNLDVNKAYMDAAAWDKYAGATEQKPAPAPTPVIHQYSSSGRLPGYNGNLDVNKAYMDAAAWDKYAGATEQKPAPAPTPVQPSGNPIVKDGQVHARNFASPGLVADGIRGANTKRAGIRTLQQAMNLDYHAGLALDGIWGTKTERALGRHTVRRGETQYMVTALQILLMLKGYNPSGLENPGIFGARTEAAVRKYQADRGLTVDGIAGYNTFKSLIQ